MAKFHFPKDATPLEDISDLKLTWIQNQRDLNRAEAENISHAQKIFLRLPISDPSKWFHLSFFRKVHLAMFGKVWDWAGKWRKSSTNIGVKPQFIPMHLSELSCQVISWTIHSTPFSVIESSARIHHQLVRIHPFENGNGRFARLIADRYLLAYNSSHPIWPLKIGRDGSVRKEYITSLKRADEGSYQLLIQFMETYL